MSYITTTDANGVVIRRRKSRRAADWERTQTTRAEHDAIQEIRRALQTLDKRLKLSGSN